MDSYEISKEDLLRRDLNIYLQQNAELNIEAIPFQSGLSFKNNPKKIKLHIINALMEEIDDDEDTSVYFWLASCFSQMIHVEKILYQQEYAVFYRIISDQYIAYEFHSMFLFLFHHQFGPRSLFEKMVEGDRSALMWPFVCTNTILIKEYPQDIRELISKMDINPVEQKSFSDMHVSANVLLSANCCCIGAKTGTSKFTYNFSSDPETGYFWEGYNGRDWFTAFCVKQVLEFIHCYDTETQQTVIQQLEYIYRDYLGKCSVLQKEGHNGKHNDSGAEDSHEDTMILSTDSDTDLYRDDTYEGHMVQICIPFRVLEKYAYPSVAYGCKIDAYTLKDSPSKIVAEISTQNDRYNDRKHINKEEILRTISFQELLRTEHLSRIQARIMAHPDMYIKDNAYCHVYSGLQNFDPLIFRHKMVLVMQPIIENFLKSHKNSAHP